LGLVDDADERAQDFRHALSGCSGHDERRLSGGTPEPRCLFLQLLRAERIGLVERHDFRLFGKPLAVGFEFAAHDLVSLSGVVAGAVDEMQQHAAALDMAEEAVPQTEALVGAFDQTRYVGEHEFVAVDAHDAELRMECCERIVSDLGFCGAHGREQRGFSGIGQSHDAGVGNQLEPKPYGALLAWLAQVGAARRPVGRGLEMRIAEATVAAFCEHGAFSGMGKIGKEGLAVLLVDLRAHRYLHDHILAIGAMAVLAHAGAAIPCLEMLLIAIVDERVEPVDRLGDHVAAPAAVAAVRSAEFDEFLAAERHAAVPAIAGTNVDLGFVEKLHFPSAAQRVASGEITPYFRNENSNAANPGQARDYGLRLWLTLSPAGSYYVRSRRVGHQRVNARLRRAMGASARAFARCAFAHPQRLPMSATTSWEGLPEAGRRDNSGRS
jgi:hypothetical protein